MSFKAKDGGKKGEAIVATIAAHPEWTRKQVAEHVGCTVGRVGEVVRHRARENGQAGAQPDDGVRFKEKPSAEAQPHEKQHAALPGETRTKTCEHERAKKTKKGTCKVCPPVAA